MIEAVDAVEASRGFRPPLFVDVRIRRSVRAVGFNGSAFEKLLGPDRHRWLRSLGNERIITGTGPPIQIADPTAVNTLLGLAVASAEQSRRMIFFCGCQWPKRDGKVACHRATIAGLCVAAALRRSQSIEVVEWPGGGAGQVELEFSRDMLAAVENGRASVPVTTAVLAEVAGLSWCSTATLRSGLKRLQRLVGPARRQKGQWVLPVFPHTPDPAGSLTDFAIRSMVLRADFGLNPLNSDAESDD